MGVAYDAGSKLRSNAGKIDIGQVISQAAHDAVHNVASMYAPAAMAMHLGPAVHDFVSGMMNGGKSSGSPVAAAAKQIVNKQVAAPPAAAGPTMITLPDGTKAQMPSAAFLAANPATSAASALGPVASAAGPAAAAGPSSPLDVVRAAAMANGGLSLNQLGALTESVSRMIPPVTQKVPTQRDQAAGTAATAALQLYRNGMANAKDENTKAALLHDLYENMRGVAAPNPMYDTTTGMPADTSGN